MWVLRGFERDGGRMLSEHPLRGVDAEWLRSLLREKPDEDMYGCYAVALPVARAVAKRFGIELDPDREDYFIELDADDSWN